MALIDDVSVYPYSKCFRFDDTSDASYSSNAFFTWVMQLFDEPGYLTYPNPMKYNTPTSYTMLNGWFLDNGDGSFILQHLYGGSINTSGYTNDVLVVDYDTITTDFVESDKDKTVQDDASDIGPLLAYLTSYETSGKGRAWIRDTNSNGQIADGSSLTITSSAEVDADGASFTGDDIYANLYTLASFPGSPDPQVYIYQTHPKSSTYERIVEWSAYDNMDRGSIDVLIPVKIGGTVIDSGLVDVFARQTWNTFTHVKGVDLSSGERTPVSLETSADTVNITKGEWYLLYDASTGAGAFSVGDVIQNVSTGSVIPPSWYAEVVAVVEFSVNTTGMLTLRGLRGDVSNNDSIWVGAIDTADANGTPGDTFFSYTGGTDPTTLGQIMTGSSTGAKRLLRGVDPTEDYLVLAVDHTHLSVTGTNRNPYYRDFTTADTVTGASNGSVTPDADSVTIVSGYSDITLVHINGTAAHGGTTGTFIPGERVTWTGGGVGWVVKDNGTDTITLGNVDPTDEPANTDVITGDMSSASCTVGVGGWTNANTATFAFPLQSAYTYSMFAEGGSIYEAGRTLNDFNMYMQYLCRDGSEYPMYTSNGTTTTVLYGEAYITAKSSYTVSKAYPFGQKAGSTFFGAQGLWIEGLDSAEANNRRLTDDGGTLRQPDTSMTVYVGNTRAYDSILVAEKHATLNLPKKDQYVSHATANTQGDATIEQEATSPGPGFPKDTPLGTGSTGTVFMIDNTNNEEHRYRYSSWANTGGSGDDGVLTLAASDSGTAEGTSTGQQLDDTGVFDDVEVGDIIRRTNGSGGWAYIVSITSTDQVITTKLSAGGGWTSGDTFETNRLVTTYDGSDTFYIPYLDVIESTGTEGAPGNEQVDLTYVSNRDVIIIARNSNSSATTQIQEALSTSTITINGLTVDLIRTEDTVGAY